MSEHEPTPFTLMLTLGIAGLLCGAVLVAVFELTKEDIARNQAAALEAAIFRVLPGTAARQAMRLKDGAVSFVENGASPSDIGVYRGLDAQGIPTGFAIVNHGPGFQDTIRLIYGLASDRSRVVGLEVLESRETPGLGDKIIRDTEFLDNFKSLRIDPEIRLVKKGRKSSENEVDAISGATISSRAVVKIINASNEKWKAALPADSEDSP